MEVGRIENATRVLGKSQGYLGLPVRDEVVNCAVGGPDTPCMTTAWIPNIEELAALNAGASIHVCLIGKTHPPIIVSIGPLSRPTTRKGLSDD